MNTIEVKTSELEGDALDWAVATAIGAGVLFEDWGGPNPWVVLSDHAALEWVPFSPSTDWSQGGPLIEKYRLEIVFDGSRNEGWRCVKDWCYGEVNDTYPLGETHLSAACRAIVAAKLGDVVQVPAELIGATARSKESPVEALRR